MTDDISLMLREPFHHYQFLNAKCYVRVESRIADAVCKNPRLIKIGMKFEFKDVLNRWDIAYDAFSWC